VRKADIRSLIWFEVREIIIILSITGNSLYNTHTHEIHDHPLLVRYITYIPIEQLHRHKCYQKPCGTTLPCPRSLLCVRFRLSHTLRLRYLAHLSTLSAANRTLQSSATAAGRFNPYIQVHRRTVSLLRSCMMLKFYHKNIQIGTVINMPHVDCDDHSLISNAVRYLQTTHVNITWLQILEKLRVLRQSINTPHLFPSLCATNPRTLALSSPQLRSLLLPLGPCLRRKCRERGQPRQRKRNRR
jgi:hypothetical protein